MAENKNIEIYELTIKFASPFAITGGKNMQAKRMNAQLLLNSQKIPKPTERLPDTKGDTVRQFPTKRREVELSPLDEFLVSLGVKDMANTKATTSPLEWNSKVIGLIAVVFSLLLSLGGMIWYAAGLAADVRSIQRDMIKQETQHTAETTEFKQRLMKIEDYQRQADLRNEASRGYKLGQGDKESDHPK